MNILDKLISNIGRLPGIGHKSSKRIAYYLLNADKKYIELLGTQILEIQEKIKKCQNCGNWSEFDVCEICSDTMRDSSLLCVVENSSDVYTIERTGDFNGYYHVLGGTISPLDGVGPDDISINQLLEKCKLGYIKELILATNPTVQGDTTALYILNELKNSNIKITKLASGLPVGGDLEYIDSLTLSRSLKGRVIF